MTRTPSKWRDMLGMFVFHAARVLEFIFPPATLRYVLYPVAAILAWRDLIRNRFSLPPFHHLPSDWPTVPTNVLSFFRICVRHHLSRAIANWPDRLGERPWRKRFSIDGKFLEQAMRARRPIILVTAHFGPFHLAAYFLRAFGFPVATFLGNAQLAQSAPRRVKDRLSHFPELPHIFSAEDNLRNVYRFLEQGNILRTAFDVKTGKLIEVPMDDRSVCFATGSIRLAAATGATLIPYVISERDSWKFVVHLGQPVPNHLLGDSLDVEGAATHIVKECSRFFRTSPDEAGGEMVVAFSSPQTETESIPL